MPKISFLFKSLPFWLQLTNSLSSLALFLIDFSPRAAQFLRAAQAFAGESPDSPLMAVAA